MNQTENVEINDVVQLDLGRIIDAVLKKSSLILLLALIFAAVSLFGTYFLITPEYESSAMFYVNNNSLSVADASFSITSGDLSTSRNLVESYLVILNTWETLTSVLDYADVGHLTYEDLSEMIAAEAVNQTEIFQVVVTSSDPAEAEKLANAIAYILPKRIDTIIDGTSAKIVSSAVLPSKPSSPSILNNTIIGFLLSVVLSVAYIAFKVQFDISIRTEEDIAHCTKHPVLAAVPDMTAPSKGGYYGYGEKKHSSSSKRQAALVGDDMNFAATEAYKLLRTKIQYSFAGDKDCRVIGVSSALTGEGKSLTAVNLAHSLSQLNNKVLLIDCDMRRPSLPAKLPIQKKPGLSGYLSGQVESQNLIQFCGIKGDEQAFHVIASGQNPPNPVELLSSARMTKMLTQLREEYDYVILDLPPIGEVTDALAVVKETDGVLLVVRQNYCDRVVLTSAIRQFEFVGTRILGITYNCTDDSSNGYGKKYYKKYHNNYSAYDTKAQKGKS